MTSPKFILESNLSKLARWLRFMGYPAHLLEGKISKETLSKHQDKVFITTSRKWHETAHKIGMETLLVPRHDWKLQLRAAIENFNLTPELKLNICAYCNTTLRKVSREEIKDLIPPGAYKTAKDFTLCPNCGHIFWKGTHYERMIKTLREISKGEI